MTVKRDYGNFATASRKILASLVQVHGYEFDEYGLFTRRKSGWLEGFGLQQTRYGDGSFCINMGIVVPALGKRWLADETHDTGFIIHFRLSESGADGGDCWLPAADKAELERSLGQLASWLASVEPWFAQFTQLSDVARIYKDRANLPVPGQDQWQLQLAAANYGFLLAEAGEHEEARKWLAEAEYLMSLPVYHAPGWPGILHKKVKGARLQKPTADEARQLQAVRLSLLALQDSGCAA